MAICAAASGCRAAAPGRRQPGARIGICRRFDGYTALSAASYYSPRIKAVGPSSMTTEWFSPIDALMEHAVDEHECHDYTAFIDELLTTDDTDVLRVSTGFETPKRQRHESPVGSPVSTLQIPRSGKVPPPAIEHSADLSPSSSPSSGSASGANVGGGPSRKNKPQRCSICKEMGHKARTCRLAPGKGEPPPNDQPPAPPHHLTPCASRNPSPLARAPTEPELPCTPPRRRAPAGGGVDDLALHRREATATDPGGVRFSTPLSVLSAVDAFDSYVFSVHSFGMLSSILCCCAPSIPSATRGDVDFVSFVSTPSGHKLQSWQMRQKA